MRQAVADPLRGVLVLALCGLLGCRALDQGDATGDGNVPVLTLGEPTLEIGAIDGAEPYVFAALETVVRLPDGRIAVSDGGATRIALFDAAGTHVLSWGRRGDGPAEFNDLSRVYPFGPDSLMAAERSTGRVSLFDLSGSFGRLVSAWELSGDSVFGLDSWLYRRFWVEGALTAERRGQVRAALDRLPLPATAPGYRLTLAGEDGSLWIREPGRVAGGHVWTRLNASGTPSAAVTIPARFTPTHFRANEVLGIWRGEADVPFVRAYAWTAGSGASPVPSWLSGSGPEWTGGATPAMDDVMTLMRGAIRQMAGAQEVHYSTHMSYADVTDSLTAFEPPDELWIDFVKGDARGWAGVFVHPGVDRMCALAYGFGIPPGWTPGMIACAPAIPQPPAG